MYYLGVDVGSLTCDAVIIDEDEQLKAWQVVSTGARNIQAIERARAKVLESTGIAEAELKAVVATGYGRDRVDDRLASVTEITCHARGIQKLLPGTEVLVDIGGQDSKAIRLSPEGKVLEFAMNDKCAAGTGRFLEAMARALEVTIDQLGQLDRDTDSDLVLSSMCTVFAESEVVSLIAEGADVAHIVRGLHRAIAVRTQSLLKRVAKNCAELKIAMSGGVARNPGVVRALTAGLGVEIAVPSEPDTVGALGAALIARERSLL
ncbi:MAG: 2-hydroxyglutaryl-CoA dehydratase [Proteobacteria bacterium]|nr:2-hydroxyglutaryl-CoA dehydratase [Pseudomonadota bacterium]